MGISESVNHKIAVIIPCYNEGKTIAKVVSDFRSQLPHADIYVYDNNSTDNTVEEAKKAGAYVRYERRQGKGNVVRSMFKDIEADVYVMVDGDGTYPADKVHSLIRPIIENDADMVIGSRLHPLSESHFKMLNQIGNIFFLFFINTIFRLNITDLLSGYRAFNKRLVKNLPILSRGFEIETELTVKAIERGYRIVEAPINLSPRPEGSRSKIKVFRDGFLIFNTIFALFRDYKPLTVFGLSGMTLVILGIFTGVVVIREFILNGYITHLPLAILAMALGLTGILVILVGLLLHTISRRFQELDYQLQNLAESLHYFDSKDKDKFYENHV